MKIFLLPTTPSFVTVLDELGLQPILSSPGCQIVIRTVKKSDAKASFMFRKVRITTSTQCKMGLRLGLPHNPHGIKR